LCVVEVYGKNVEFGSGATDGTLLGTGARTSNATDDSSDWNAPIGLTGGEYATTYMSENLNRVTTIPETSLTSSFRYYRLRYSGSFHGLTINQNPFSITETVPKDVASGKGQIFVNEIIPCVRTFQQGTLNEFNDGGITATQITTNYVNGTSSYALYAEEAGIAANGFPFTGDAVISGSLSVSGTTNLGNLMLNGNLDLNNYSIENTNNINATSINVGHLESNNITTNTLDTNILTIGTLPISTPEISNGINTTGPISITTIIPSNITESYTTEPEILSVQKRQGPTGVYWDNLFGPGGKLKLSSSNFAFTSGSTSSLNDNNTNTSIIVNQNTLGTYYVPAPGEGPYPLYPLSTNDLAVEVHQTNSFFIKYKFPEPVLLEEFRINFSGESGTFSYSEQTMSLDSANFSLGKDFGASHTSASYELRSYTNAIIVSNSFGNDPNYIDSPTEEFLSASANQFKKIINENANIGSGYITLSGTGRRSLNLRHFSAGAPYTGFISNVNEDYTTGYPDQPFVYLTQSLNSNFHPGASQWYPQSNYIQFSGTSPVDQAIIYNPTLISHSISSFTTAFGNIGYSAHYNITTIINEIPYAELYNESRFQDVIINYDFGEGNGEAVHRYQIRAVRGIEANLSSQDRMFFEASNDGINFTVLDEIGNTTVWERIQALGIPDNYNGFGFIDDPNPYNFPEDNPDPNISTITEEGQILTPASVGNSDGLNFDRGINHFTNNTTFRYYRFRFPEQTVGADCIISKIAFFTASIEQSGTTQFNPEFISIYSNDTIDTSDITDTIYAPFAFYPGTFKGTQTVLANDSNITTSIAQFNIDNQHPLSQYYTIEISGSHDPNNLVGISEITPITRSFTTESITIGTIPPSPTPPTGYPVPTGPNIYWPSLPEGHPQGTDCSNANAVYYNESAGTFYYTSSCGSSNLVTTDEDGDIVVDGSITGDDIVITNGGSIGGIDFLDEEIKPKVGKKLKIKADKIIPVDGKKLILGDPAAPIETLHIKQGTIHFYSSSDAYSGSEEVASMTINESSKEIEFKSGSEFSKIRASEINLGSSDAFNGIGSVQIGQSTQGFIAVNAEPGKFSTVLRAESPTSTGDFRMGSITQKGSGSFAILLDADQIRPDAKFGVYSNTAVPGLTTPLITVSESFETRIHNGGLRADNYVTTTNITASGNISGSHVTTASFGSLQLSNLPTTPTGLPTGSVWVSGSKNDSSTSNVNCGTLMIVI
jgi:hypothetical protein